MDFPRIGRRSKRWGHSWATQLIGSILVEKWKNHFAIGKPDGLLSRIPPAPSFTSMARRPPSRNFRHSRLERKDRCVPGWQSWFHVTPESLTPRIPAHG